MFTAQGVRTNIRRPRHSNAARPAATNHNPVAKLPVVSTKKGTPEKRFADLLMGGYQGPWSGSVNHTSDNALVRKWNGRYWQQVGEGEGVALAARWLNWAVPDKAKPKTAKSAWDFAAMRFRDDLPMPNRGLGRNIVPCNDVYLEIGRDGLINALAPDKELGMTYALTIDAGTEAGRTHVPGELPADSMFRRWLERSQPDAEVRSLIQEQCGMTLLPGVYSVAAWWYGVAGAGKSMLAELCESLQRQVARISLENLSETFGVEAVVGASLILVDEVEAEKWGEGRFKSLVSGNGISVNRKNQKHLHSYHSTSKWIITSNSAPFVRDKSDGTWRRICAVKWDVVLPASEHVENFHKVLLEREGRAILDWMLEGARRIVMRGRFLSDSERPLAIQQVKTNVRTSSDSVLAWVEDEDVRYAPGSWASVEDVYKCYETACEAAHRDCLTKSQFWRQVYSSPRLGGVSRHNHRVHGKQTSRVELAWGPRPPAPTPPSPRTVADIRGPQEVRKGDNPGDDFNHPHSEEGEVLGWAVTNAGVSGPLHATREAAQSYADELRAAILSGVSP